MIIPLLLFIFSFILRLTLISKGAYHVDTVSIITQADNALATLQLQYSYGFGFPLTIILSAIFIFILKLFSIHDSVFAVNLMSVTFSSLSVSIFYLIIKEIFDRPTALLGATILCLLPSFLGISVYGNTHAPSLFFLLWGIYWLVLSQNSGKINHIILGAVGIGLMGGCRLQDMVLMSVPLTFLVYTAGTNNSSTSILKRIFLFWILSAGIAIALHLPMAMGSTAHYLWNIKSYSELGATTLYRGLNSTSLLISLNVALFNLTVLGLIGAALGLYKLSRKSSRTAVFLLLWFIAPFALYGNMTSCVSRYLVISILPLIIALAYLLSSALRRPAAVRYAYILIIAWVLLIPFAKIFSILKFRHLNDPIGDYARWVRDTTPADSVIITADDGLFLKFYGKREFIYQLTSIYSPITKEQFEKFKNTVDSLLRDGKNVYITETGIFANNPDNHFYQFLLENYDLYLIGGRAINDFHFGEIYEKLFFNKLVRIRPKAQ